MLVDFAGNNAKTPDSHWHKGDGDPKPHGRHPILDSLVLID